MGRSIIKERARDPGQMGLPGGNARITGSGFLQGLQLRLQMMREYHEIVATYPIEEVGSGFQAI